jgi:3-dehydroquinate synthetase
LPISLKDVGLGDNVSIEQLKNVVSRDKKIRRGRLAIPVVVDIGSWRAVEVTVEEFVEVFSKCVK